ncbi:MAG TPA: hemerythrin family protein [Anaeromyxobacteraceae bacterium]|jgi:hemerythrin-like metal-binding protein
MWLRTGYRLSVGFAELDESHRRVLPLFERTLAEAQACPEPTPALRRLVEQLAGALEDHFRFEEELMEAWRYPWRRRHRAAHDALREELEFVVTALREARLGPGLRGLIASQVPAWIEDHMWEDAQLGGFLAARRQAEGAAPPPGPAGEGG